MSELLIVQLLARLKYHYSTLRRYTIRYRVSFDLHLIINTGVTHLTKIAFYSRFFCQNYFN